MAKEAGNHLGQTLKRIRESIGYASARSFFLFLSKRIPTDFKYPYYTRIESGETFPSAKVINQIATQLPNHLGNELVRVYCMALFPNRREAFRSDRPNETPSEVAPRNHRAKPLAESGRQQLELNGRQVDIISKSQHHYYLFLAVTLARRGLSPKELESIFPAIDLKQAMKDLEDAQVAIIEGDFILPAFPEYRFPRAEAGNLRQTYERLDKWDQQRGRFFGLQEVTHKQMFRRVSSRNVGLLLKGFDLLYEMNRLSDESDVSFNDSVVSLVVRMEAGKIPG
jgi:transcriptional regulator with XRE-family HTH domain